MRGVFALIMMFLLSYFVVNLAKHLGDNGSKAYDDEKEFDNSKDKPDRWYPAQKQKHPIEQHNSNKQLDVAIDWFFDDLIEENITYPITNNN